LFGSHPASFLCAIASAAANVRISSAELATSTPNLGLVSHPPRNACHSLGRSAQIRSPFRRTQRRRHAFRGFGFRDADDFPAQGAPSPHDLPGSGAASGGIRPINGPAIAIYHLSVPL
jgi:hypothetical protein